MFYVYSKPSCASCEKAKQFLESKGLDYKVINLDVGQPKELTGEYISRDALLALFPSARTMPQITRDGIYIGGYQELVQHLA